MMSLSIFKQPSVQDLVKDVYLRKALANCTVGAVKDVQMEALRNPERKIMQGDAANRFCEVIEAIFLHGSKGRLTKMMSEVFGGSRLPKPDFWDVVMLYTHRDDLQTLSSLDQIHSDIGRCRAWVRLVINDGTLSSFIECIAQDAKALPSFYRSSAFLRDPELVAIVVRLLGSLSGHVKITLPLNVAALNVWQKQPLLLSGFWKQDGTNGDVGPVMRGVDVDDYFITSSSETSPTKKAATEKALSHRLPTARDRGTEEARVDFALTKSIAHEIEQALKKEQHDQRLSHTDREQQQRQRQRQQQQQQRRTRNADEVSRPGEESQKEAEVRQLLDELQLDCDEGFRTLEERDEPVVPITSNVKAAVGDVCEDNCFTSLVEDLKYAEPGNTARSWAGGLIEQSQGWSSPFHIPGAGVQSANAKENGQEAETSEEASFDAILNSYTKHITANPPVALVGTPELSNMLAQVYGSKMRGHSPAVDARRGSDDDNDPADENENQNEDVDGQEEEGEDEDFELIPKPDREDERTLELLENFGKIPREFGLDQQSFECFGCKCSIGMIFGPYRKCSLDGHLYCQECFCGGSDEPAEEHVVPSRIVHDWDLRALPVCRFNKRFLLKYEQEPLLDIRELNPVLYSVVPHLSTIQSLRRQLGFLRLYLFSCSHNVSLQLQKMVWPREYLYEHVHLYSTLDLLSVSSGTLQRLLEKACQFATKHVLSCQLCGQKGFICELCSDPKVIFPFNMVETYFCELCSALYHRSCMQEHGNSCNKCERRRQRQERLTRQEEQSLQDSMNQNISESNA